MINTIIFFFALYLSFLTFSNVASNIIQKKHATLEHGIVTTLTIILWTFFYYLTHTN